MSAPTLREDWRSCLLAMQPGWDSYKAEPITNAALDALGSFYAVPCHDGGIQLEVHRDGWDIEIVLTPEGRIASAFAACEPKELPKP